MKYLLMLIVLSVLFFSCGKKTEYIVTPAVTVDTVCAEKSIIGKWHCYDRLPFNIEISSNYFDVNHESILQPFKAIITIDTIYMHIDNSETYTMYGYELSESCDTLYLYPTSPHPDNRYYLVRR